MSDVIFYVFVIALMGTSYLFLKRNSRQKAVQRAPAREAEAAARGWTYSFEQTPMFEIERWEGSTNGVAWIGEAARSGVRRSLSLTGAGTATGESVTHVTRWYTTQQMPVSGPGPLLEEANDDGRRNEISSAVADASPLARKLISKVLDVGLPVRFGTPIGGNVEGGSLKPATLPTTGHDGYSLMAADPSEASALLFQRLGPVLDEARAAAGPAPLSILITPRGLAVSVPNWTFKTDELVPIVNAGLVLVKALR